MIRATNIKKSYGDLQVLKGIDLQISKSEIVSIVGKSGAGKSTLLQILGTLDKPDVTSEENLLIIDSQDVVKMTDKQLAHFRNQTLGFIFQFHQLLPEFSAIENVCLPAWIGKTPKAEATKKATELLNFLGLSHRISHRPNELSGGEQQRVAVARALINQPAVVFADEPSGNLDTAGAQQLHQLFFDLRKEFNQTFVIVTHNEELAEMADRKLIISDGKIL